VHVQPIRYPAAHAADWKARRPRGVPRPALASGPAARRLKAPAAGAAQARIVSAGPGHVVLDKPAGVPVVPSVDNVLECCLACAAQVRARPGPCRCCARPRGRAVAAPAPGACAALCAWGPPPAGLVGAAAVARPFGAATHARPSWPGRPRALAPPALAPLSKVGSARAGRARPAVVI